MPTYEEALKWYKQGIIDSNEGQEMFEDGVEADFHMIYGSQFPEQKEQPSYSGIESAEVLKQKLDDLIELVTDDKLVLHATPVTGRPHDPNPEISRLRDEIVAEFSTAAPSLKSHQPCIVMPGISSDPNFGELPGAKITIPISSLKEKEIAFAEWILQEEFYLEDGKWWKNGLKGWQDFTTEQIYQEYLKSLNKKP